MTPNKPIVIDSLTKTFDEIIALDDLSLSTEAGVLGLIGPNGAGKTTLLRTLLGLIAPDSGRAMVLGLDVEESSLEIRGRIGVLHERMVFPAQMEAREYLSDVVGLYDGVQEPDDLLGMVGLGAAAGRQIGNFSAGMRQRLGIALAFAGDPELVFLDEPTSNLDVLGRDQILGLIVDLYQESGVSFIIASHVLSELERVCSHVAFIDRGRILEHGTTNGVIQRHGGNKFRILCSDSDKLLSYVKQMDSVRFIQRLGTTGIQVEIEDDPQRVLEQLGEFAESVGVKFYGLEKSATLEDAFKGAIS